LTISIAFKVLRLPKARTSDLRPTAGRTDRVAATLAKVNEPSRRFNSETEEAVKIFDCCTLDILVRDLDFCTLDILVRDLDFCTLDILVRDLARILAHSRWTPDA